MGMLNIVASNIARYSAQILQQNSDGTSLQALPQNGKTLTTSGTGSSLFHTSRTTAADSTLEEADSNSFTPNSVALLPATSTVSYLNIQQLISAGADPSQILPPTQAIGYHPIRQTTLSEGTKELALIFRDGNNTIANNGFETTSLSYEFKTPEQTEDVGLKLASPESSFTTPATFVTPVVIIAPTQIPEPKPSPEPPPVAEKPKPQPEPPITEPEPPTPDPELPTAEKPKPQPEPAEPEPDLPAVITPEVTHISMDTGFSDADGITSDNTLYFFGNSAANCVIEVFIDGISVGFTISNSKGEWVFNHTDTVLPDGNYIITAQSTNEHGIKSPESKDFPILIDTSDPELEPELWDIQGSNGNGASDGFIDDGKLIFSGKAEPDTIVELYIDDISIGTTTTNELGDWRFDNTHINLADGSYTLTLTSFDKAGNSTAMPYEVPFEIVTAWNDFSSFLIEDDSLLTSSSEPNATNSHEYSLLSNLQSEYEAMIISLSQPEPLDLQDVLIDHESASVTQLIPATNLQTELPSTASNDQSHSNELQFGAYNNILLDSLLENHEQTVVHG
ncbi:hypothetical protein H0A36_12595 [Endozoicomonas sp. SM1973]|uniref:Bacterial Ig-like domain-containing protein n=1 Tax=Spartinivicinus marinus TaxID=2994442 RepID=A0A853I5I3_9GAMM|nr:Ig-like domain-containing protein [Spartinivicinus marinus]MCX4026480.1 Ig-like domain-containing protein [Spartinivicinus marinus]NYZ66852.1 hypothetical protein [Spartinivicinus marinus]